MPTYRSSALRIVGAALLVALALAMPAAAQKKRAPKPADPAAVVRTLYSYHFKHKFDWTGTLAHNRELFAPDLLKLLDEVDRAQAANPDEIVGLDFDPLVDAQEEAQTYRITGTKREGDEAIVTVTANIYGSPRTMRLRLAQFDGAWRITNINYAEYDLVTILKEPLQ